MFCLCPVPAVCCARRCANGGPRPETAQQVSACQQVFAQLSRGLMRPEAGQQVSACEQVFALDLLGFGRSDKPLLGYTLELWRDLVLDFLQEFVAGAPAVLVGNSMGSLICLNVRPAPGGWATSLGWGRSQKIGAGVFLLQRTWAMSAACRTVWASLADMPTTAGAARCCQCRENGRV